MSLFLRRSLSTARPLTSVAPHGHLSNSRSPITTQLNFVNSITEDGSKIPTFRVLDGAGKILEGAQEPEVSSLGSNSYQAVEGPCYCLWSSSTRRLEESCMCPSRNTTSFLNAFGYRYETMNLLPAVDNVLYNVQRQGKISFWVCVLFLV